VSRGFKVSLWALGIFLLLIILPGLALFSPVFTGIMCLIAGWIRYAAEVLPLVTVSGEGILLMAVCLALAAAVGHGFCRWLWRGTGRGRL